MQRLRLGMLLNTRACTAQPLAISLPGSQASPRPVGRKEDEQASPRSSASRERHNLEMGQRKNKKQGQTRPFTDTETETASPHTDRCSTSTSLGQAGHHKVCFFNQQIRRLPTGLGWCVKMGCHPAEVMGGVCCLFEWLDHHWKCTSPLTSVSTLRPLSYSDGLAGAHTCTYTDALRNRLHGQRTRQVHLHAFPAKPHRDGALQATRTLHPHPSPSCSSLSLLEPSVLARHCVLW